MTFEQWIMTGTGGRVFRDESVWNREEFGREAYEAGIIAERERCAGIAESYIREDAGEYAIYRIVAIIRKGADHV